MNMYFFDDINGSTLVNEMVYQIKHYNDMLAKYKMLPKESNENKEYNGIFDRDTNRIMRFAQSNPKITQDDAKVLDIPRKKETYRISFDILIHILIERTLNDCLYNYDETILEYQPSPVCVSSIMLKKLLGDKYRIMLEVLCKFGIITKYGSLDGNKYRLKKLNFQYKNISEQSVYYPLIVRYESYVQQSREQEMNMRLIEAEERLGSLYKPYMNALCKLKCNTKKMKQYIELHKNELNSFQYGYYTLLLSRYEQGGYTIQRVDDNNRIYTILTQTPSHAHSLLPFTNIKYEVDLSNCHPMLFNYIIMQYYHMLPKTVEKINNPFFSAVGTWKKSATKKYPRDVEEYMELTFKGQFWDVLLGKYIGLSRKQIKPKMFANVFYAKNLRICPNQTYGKDFQKRFPSIMKIIRRIRRYNKTILAQFLMQIESGIIQDAMKTLNNEGYIVLNIHDAIVVLDVVENKKLTEQHVKDVLLKSVQKYGLSANAKIEHIKR